MKRKWMRVLAGVLAAALLITAMGVPVMAEENDTVISLGEDLNDAERSTVLDLLGVSEEELLFYPVIYVSNAEEHEYLDATCDPARIGDRALSSSKTTLREEGYGIQVTTYNIDYCTVGMYQNALLTAGVQNADVVIAGPESKIAGTAALIGVMKAYQDSTDGALSEDNIQAATEELSLTSQLGEILGDNEKAEQLMVQLKSELDNIDFSDTEAVDAEIRRVADEMGVSLSDEQVVKIREFLEKLSTLDLDVETFKAQVSEFLGEFAADDPKLAVVKVFYDIGNFFSGLFEQVSGFFENLFNSGNEG